MISYCLLYTSLNIILRKQSGQNSSFVVPHFAPIVAAKSADYVFTKRLWFSIQHRVSVVYIRKVAEIREKVSQIAVFYTHEANNVRNVTCFKGLQLRVPSTIISWDTQHFLIESVCETRLQKPVVSFTGPTVLVRN